jgi:hypothetical protein
MGAPRPPPVKLFATFLFEVVEAKRVEFLKKKFDYVKCPHLMNVMNIIIWSKVHPKVS